MADTNKTEQPTQRRIRRARQDGQVTQSQEMLTAVTLLALLLSVFLFGPSFLNWAKTQIRDGLSCQASMMSNAQAFSGFVNALILDMLMILAPFLIVLMIAGVGGALLVSGLNFAPKSLKWKVENLSPARGLKTLFSPESLVKLGLAVAKISLIGIIVWMYLRNRLDLLATLQWMDSDQVLGAIAKLIFGVVFRICLALLVVGLIDWFYRKWRYIEKLKMSKQEVKYEHRDTEGSPEIKSKIRQKQYESAMRRMLQEVPKANVVLVNPDHVAVALRYDPKQTATPVVVAKGADHMCEKIKEIARSYGVPILRRPPLARELYATVKLGQAIPEKLFAAVAEILALIYRLRHNR